MSFTTLRKGSVSFGRGEDCTVPLDDPRASRRHALVLRQGDRVWISDEGSANGVFVDGARVTRARLESNALVRLGDTLLVFVDPGPAASSAELPVHVQGFISGPRFEHVRHLLDRAARHESPLLIEGATGTGKELAARHPHERGPRCKRPFIAVNCAAMPTNLLESELFGHVRGAFTGADRDRPGLLREAEGGTLFLDEVGELPAASQSKLLRVVEERAVRPVGGAEAVPVDVRLISATHVDLRAAAEAGEFRLDLYARLAHLVIRLPPLRERSEDIPLLAQSFLQNIGAPDQRFSADAMEQLCLHTWPLNIRELASVVERAVFLADGEALLTPRHLELMVPAEPKANTPLPRESPESAELREALTSLEGDVEAVARALGLSRSQVYRRAQKYALHPAAFRAAGRERTA